MLWGIHCMETCAISYSKLKYKLLFCLAVLLPLLTLGNYSSGKFNIQGNIWDISLKFLQVYFFLNFLLFLFFLLKGTCYASNIYTYYSLYCSSKWGQCVLKQSIQAEDRCECLFCLPKISSSLVWADVSSPQISYMFSSVWPKEEAYKNWVVFSQARRTRWQPIIR